MRKVKVACTVNYTYEADIDLVDDEDIEVAVDGLDPVYNTISSVLRIAKLNYNGQIDSVVDNDTGEILYMI